MGTTSTTTSEIVLIRAKAKRMTNGQLADEIRRCQHGMQVAASKSAAARFERRLLIMQDEADLRMRVAGGAR